MSSSSSDSGSDSESSPNSPAPSTAPLDEPTLPESSKPAPSSSSSAPTSAPRSQTSDSVISSQSFASLGVDPSLVSACSALGWSHASTIQAEALPPALLGRDIIGLAETGSGKTGAFSLPILQALLKEPQPLFAVVLAPTRELAFQVRPDTQPYPTTPRRR